MFVTRHFALIDQSGIFFFFFFPMIPYQLIDCGFSCRDRHWEIAFSSYWIWIWSGPYWNSMETNFGIWWRQCLVIIQSFSCLRPWHRHASVSYAGMLTMNTQLSQIHIGTHRPIRITCSLRWLILTMARMCSNCCDWIRHQCLCISRLRVNQKVSLYFICSYRLSEISQDRVLAPDVRN